MEIKSCISDIKTTPDAATLEATFGEKNISRHTNIECPNTKSGIKLKKIGTRSVSNIDQKRNPFKSITSSFIKGCISGVTGVAVGAAGTAIGTIVLGPIGGIIGGIVGSAAGEAVGSAIGEKITE